MKTVLLAIATATLAGAMTVTPELPSVQSSTLPGLLTESFDSPAPGMYPTYASPIGTFAGVEVVAPDQWGGAQQTRYAAAGSQAGALSFDLSFSVLQSYFGLYWSAADSSNRLTFYRDSTLVASFTDTQAFAGLGGGYWGNPNTGENPQQLYAYLNFSGDSFNRVVFSTTSLCCGFEADNMSIRGSATPEPGTLVMLAIGVPLVLMRRRRG